MQILDTRGGRELAAVLVVAIIILLGAALRARRNRGGT